MSGILSDPGLCKQQTEPIWLLHTHLQPWQVCVDAICTKRTGLKRSPFLGRWLGRGQSCTVPQMAWPLTDISGLIRTTKGGAGFAPAAGNLLEQTCKRREKFVFCSSISKVTNSQGFVHSSSPVGRTRLSSPLIPYGNLKNQETRDQSCYSHPKMADNCIQILLGQRFKCKDRYATKSNPHI